jgi:hypothetical protein
MHKRRAPLIQLKAEFMYSSENKLFKISKNFDKKRRFENINFELIFPDSKFEYSNRIDDLKEEVLQLYNERDWKIPLAEIEESFQKSEIIVLVKKAKKVCGFFSARKHTTELYGEFYYLERLIISYDIPPSSIVLITALLITNFPEFGLKKITICSITRLKIIGTLFELFGKSAFCNTALVPITFELKKKIKIFMKILSGNDELFIDNHGVLKNIFVKGFMHNDDRRLIYSRYSMAYNDAVFIMNTIPATIDEIFSCLYKTAAFNKHNFIYNIVDSLKNKNLFVQVKTA